MMLRFLVPVLAFSLPNLAAESRPNVLFICVDDLRPELACYGQDYIHSPNIDALAKRGTLFTHHYAQAPTCGASRFALWTGNYGPVGNNAFFSRAAAIAADRDNVPPSLPAFFRENGYTTSALGKVSHHPGGRGGPDWDDADKLEMPLSWDRQEQPVGKWKHPRGLMHGLADGEIRVDASKMPIFQAADGRKAIYPDDLTVAKAVQELTELAEKDEPFFLTVGLLKPHLPLGAPAKFYQLYAEKDLPPTPHPKRPTERTTWHGSGEFMNYYRWEKNPNEDADFALEVRRHYAACVSYTDDQIGKLFAALAKSPAAKNTLIILWSDHGWHLGEHGIWGKHSLFDEALHAPLIVSLPGQAMSGQVCDTIVESIDLFPTICKAANLAAPANLPGRSLLPVIAGEVKSEQVTEASAVSYSPSARTIRNSRYRLIEHSDGYCELYDEQSSKGETKNIAKKNPKVVAKLREQLAERLANQAKF